MKRFLALALAAIMSMGTMATAFAGVDDAYFFGYVGDDIDTTEEMEDVEYELDRMGYYTKIYTNPTVSRFTASRLNSSFLYFAGHGTKLRINTGDDCGICMDGTSGYKTINTTDFSNTELAILAACKAGLWNQDPIECLAGVIEDNGANCVLGWQTSPNTDMVAMYTDKYANYLRKGNTYLDAHINTREYMINNKNVITNNPVFNTALFGNVNDTLPEVADTASLAMYASNVDPINAYLNEDLNQHIITDSITYKYNSKNFNAIEAYVKENIDANFDLDNYKITEYGEEENGVNSIAFRLEVNGLTSNYGFSILCIDDEAKLINFTDSYDKVSVDELAAVPMTVSENSDAELLDMAIAADNTGCTVDEQTISRYFDVNQGKVVTEVDTVYVDEAGSYFCNTNTF